MKPDPVEDKAARHIADLQRVLEFPITESEEAAFVDMLERLRRGARYRTCLTDKQAEWLAVVIERHAPTYRNLVSSGQVSDVSHVRSMVGYLPKRPPGRL